MNKKIICNKIKQIVFRKLKFDELISSLMLFST